MITQESREEIAEVGNRTSQEMKDFLNLTYLERNHKELQNNLRKFNKTVQEKKKNKIEIKVIQIQVLALMAVIKS